LTIGEATEAGHHVLTTAVDVAVRTWGEELVAAFAIGSLAHGGFSSLTSDVDLVLLFGSDADQARAISSVAQETGQLLGSPLAERLSIFHCPAASLDSPPASARLPEIDRLDLLQHGVLLYGSDVTVGVDVPTHEVIAAEAVSFFLGKHTGSEVQRAVAAVAADDPRETTKLILAPVRLLYAVDLGLAGGNPAAVDHYHGEYRALAEAAIEWRQRGLSDDASSMVRAELVPLYGEILERLAETWPPAAARLSEFVVRMRSEA